MGVFLTQNIIGAAIEVHRILGAGLLESVDEEAPCYEFELRGIDFQRQVEIDVVYKGKIIKGQGIDLLVERQVITELKSIAKLPEGAAAQVLFYLKTTGLRRGLLITFGASKLVDRIRGISLRSLCLLWLKIL